MSNLTKKWVKALIPFTNNYLAKYTATELSKITNLPQQTISRSINTLCKNKILSYEIQGKNKLFFFNPNKQSTNMIFNILETEKSLNFILKLKKISIIINELLKCSEAIIIFGSYSSETHNKDSDIDIIILGKHNKKEIIKIKEKQIIKINEHYFTFSEFEKILNKKNTLAIEIYKNHLLFKNISKIVNIFLNYTRKIFID